MGFMDKLSVNLGNVAVKINNFRYISVIKDTFSSLIPVVITGAFATLLSAMVFDANSGLATISALSFLQKLKPISTSMSYITLSFLTIYAVFLIGVEVAKLNKEKGIFPGIIAVMCYLAINPTHYEVINNNKSIVIEDILSKQYTDTRGLFLGIIVSIASIEFYCWLNRQEKLKIKMPDSVPPNVAVSFSSLIPTVLTVTFIAVLGFITKEVTGVYAYDIIYNTLQRPLENIMQGVPGMIILITLIQVFWIIGIHGNQLFQAIKDPLLLTAVAVNTDAFQSGREVPNIITAPFWNEYMEIGGSGCTIGLIVAILLISHREDMKKIAKLSLVPGIFNINEPIIFGLPIILNPILAVPFIITPIITGGIGYFLTSIGFAGKAVIMVPWTTPPIISAYLSTAGSIGAVITQIICLIASVVIYLPFVKICNKMNN